MASEKVSRERLYRTITGAQTPVFAVNTLIYQDIYNFFANPTLFEGCTSVERRRCASITRGPNGFFPLIELYTQPSNVRIWAYQEC